MEVLIEIMLFLVLGVIIVLASRDSDRKIRDLASDVRDLDKRIGATLFAVGKNEGALEGLKKTVGELSGMVSGPSSDLGKLTKSVEALETGKVNAGDVNTTVGVAINLVKEELKKEIAKKADKSALDALAEGVNALGGEIKSLTLEVEGVVETLNIAAKEARHKAGIFEPYELVAKECGVSEDVAQSLIATVADDAGFAVAALKAGIKLTDVANVQAKVREIIAKAEAKVEAKEKKE